MFVKELLCELVEGVCWKMHVLEQCFHGNTSVCLLEKKSIWWRGKKNVDVCPLVNGKRWRQHGGQSSSVGKCWRLLACLLRNVGVHGDH